MKADAILSLNINITGREVVLLSQLATYYVIEAAKNEKVDGEMMAFAESINVEINKSMDEMNLEVQDA